MAAPDFLTQMLVFGQGGLDLLRPTDRIPPTHLARMVNVNRSQEGQITTRRGLTKITTHGFSLPHHSVRRLNDPATGTFTRVWGTGANLHVGASGVPASVDSGYSGDPLHLVPYRPPLSGETWMFVADRLRMRKVRSDGLDLPIGIAPPTVAASAALGAEQRTTVDTFDSTSGWASNVGSGGAGAAPSVASIGGAAGGSAVEFRSDFAPGTVEGGYYNFWSKAVTADLSQVGSVEASDDDLMHVWVRLNDPEDVVEVKLYVVVSAGFSTSVLPGKDPSTNTDAYVKAFTPSDFQSLVDQRAPTLRTGDRERARDQVRRSLKRGDFEDFRESWEERRAGREAKRAATESVAAGEAQWTEFGVVGVPLRRGDFFRIGSDDGRDWADVTGLVVLVQTARAKDVSVALDDLHLTGGRGPDTTEPGSIQYDYRTIDYDPRTGAKSNPSPIMAEGAFLDAVRRRITVTPQASSDSAHVQRIFRRGGTLTDNWYFVGETASNGAAFNDDLTDAEIIAAGTLELDNNRAVPSVDSAGNTVEGRPLPALWGPDQDVLMACGDPGRPGDVYWCKPGEPDHWPAANHAEVCSPSEELMSGVSYGGQSFVFSRERMYALYVNLGGVARVTPTPTACKHGLVSRWGLTTGLGQIFFVSRDGVYATSGGAEKNLTDEIARPLFHGESKNGLAPIDFSVETAIRLTFHDNELWLFYQDTNGDRQVLIYSLIFGYLRYYDFNASGRSVIAGYSDEGDELRLILGGLTIADYTHDGLSDDDQAIACQLRTPALDQGFPRQDKRYGDLILDADRAGTTLTVTPLVDNEAETLAAEGISTGSGRTRYTLDVFGETPRLARNVSIDIAWTQDPDATASPILFHGGPSYVVQPDRTDNRLTEWDAIGGMTDKYVKGLILDVDTFNTPRTVEVQRDGGTVVESFEVSANNRQIVQHAFTQQFQARLLRFRATDDQGSWILYGHRWVFDEEPLSITRWETQEVDHGVSGWQVPLYAHVTLRAIKPVRLDLIVYSQTQDGTTGGETFTYWIANTAGFKRKLYVPFRASKGSAFKYVFTSDAAFWLYREESHVVVQPWGAEQPLVAHPFGNDDLDLVRGMYDAEGVAAAPGGGQVGRG